MTIAVFSTLPVPLLLCHLCYLGEQAEDQCLNCMNWMKGAAEIRTRVVRAQTALPHFLIVLCEDNGRRSS